VNCRFSLVHVLERLPYVIIPNEQLSFSEREANDIHFDLCQLLFTVLGAKYDHLNQKEYEVSYISANSSVGTTYFKVSLSSKLLR